MKTFRSMRDRVESVLHLNLLYKTMMHVPPGQYCALSGTENEFWISSYQSLFIKLYKWLKYIYIHTCVLHALHMCVCMYVCTYVSQSKQSHLKQTLTTPNNYMSLSRTSFVLDIFATLNTVMNELGRWHRPSLL